MKLLIAFLATFALVVPFLRAEINYAAQDKLGWKLSIQAYTFGRNGVTCFDTLDLLKGMGVKYVELFPGQRLSKDMDVNTGPGMSKEVMDALKAKLKETGIEAVAFGVTGMPGDEKGARQLFDWCKELGIQNINIEPNPTDRKLFAMMDKLCAEYKMNIGLHNHPKPSTYWDPATVLKAIEGCSTRIGSCADTGHWFRSGFNAIECLKKVEGHIVQFHFKDLTKNGMHDVPWGTGDQDFMGMLKEIKRQGFKGVFSIVYEIGSGPELKDNVAKCVQAFSDACGELTK
jgi:sugar phosphate isomerase/epimerase